MKKAQSIIKQLMTIEPVKTWSLIVTLLGDMSEPQLSGKEMGNVLSHVGLKPEAIRVAIHRLKKEGWISASKNGREVIYRLSTSGIASTKAVYGEVYGTNVKYDGGWKLLLVESADALEDMEEKAIRLLKRVYLLPASCAVASNLALELDIQNRAIPDWLVERLVPMDVLETASKLHALAQTLTDESKSENVSNALNTIDRAAVRLMILHRWRKMALRENTWAHISLFPEGAMAQCHLNVTRLLADLPRLNARQFSSS